MQKIINIGVVAHVDAGKSTLVDAMLLQSGIFHENEDIVEQVMDSNDLERERGITIYSKNCSVRYKDIKINIVDTPGHADFSSEVERVINTVDTVILLVDSVEGPMPQTRFVLEKALSLGLNPILFINKIDKKDARIDEVVNMTFDLFVSLNATDKQLDFPILYGIAREGIARYNVNDTNKDLKPLFEIIEKNVKIYEGSENDHLQMQVSSLAYDDYIGRLAIGRIYKGKIKVGDSLIVSKTDKTLQSAHISKLFVNEGLDKVEVKEAYYGDIVVLAGIPDISIGDTICNKDFVDPMKPICIEEPTLSMNFLVNSSPFAGKSGKFLTIRHIKERLEKELETNVGMKIEYLDNVSDGYKIYGRGELHLSILIEEMRREGYEMSISKPEVIFKEIDGVMCEPFEKVIVTVPNEYCGTIINAINERKGSVQSIDPSIEITKLTFLVPTRGLLGYRSAFVNSTKGQGTMIRNFDSYKPSVGHIDSRKNGVLVSMESGKAMGYSLWKLSERGTLLVNAGTEVYAGMIIGICNRSDDMNVNPCKNKEMSNTRTTSTDEAITLPTIKMFTLEQALEFISEDELVEVTPDAIRLRKKILSSQDRYRVNKKDN
ncbi:MAG: translational GTPase TypA [Bacilli bacterium]|nr:translational GTPase TypA [Bacilli bacterium]